MEAIEAMSGLAVTASAPTVAASAPAAAASACDLLACSSSILRASSCSHISLSIVTLSSVGLLPSDVATILKNDSFKDSLDTNRSPLWGLMDGTLGSLSSMVPCRLLYSTLQSRI